MNVCRVLGTDLEGIGSVLEQLMHADSAGRGGSWPHLLNNRVLCCLGCRKRWGRSADSWICLSGMTSDMVGCSPNRPSYQPPNRRAIRSQSECPDVGLRSGGRRQEKRGGRLLPRMSRPPMTCERQAVLRDHLAQSGEPERAELGPGAADLLRG